MKTKKKTDEAKSKNPVSQAVRDLRIGLGESQQAFAYRMKTAIRTIARYETVRPPKGAALALFATVADETGHEKQAKVLREALLAELPPVSDLTRLGVRASTALPQINSEIRRVANLLRDESVAPNDRIANAITRLDDLFANVVKTFRPHFPKLEASENGKGNE